MKEKQEKKYPDRWFKHNDYYFGEQYICPICNEEFTFTEDSCYVAKGGYTCSWKCFLTYTKSLPPKEIPIKEKKIRKTLFAWTEEEAED